MEFSSSRCFLAAESGFGAARTKIRGRNRALPIKTSGTGGMDGSHPIKKPTSLRQGESVGGGEKTFFFLSLSPPRHRVPSAHLLATTHAIHEGEFAESGIEGGGGDVRVYFFLVRFGLPNFDPSNCGGAAQGPAQDPSAFPFPLCFGIHIQFLRFPLFSSEQLFRYSNCLSLFLRGLGTNIFFAS